MTTTASETTAACPRGRRSSTSRSTSASRAARRRAPRCRAAAHAELAAGAGPPGPGRPAREPGRDARARAGADPLRADAGLAVHLLPRRGPDHGRRPRRARRRPACACSSAATPTSRTSASSPRPSGGWSSTSTTSTRPCPGPFEWDVKRLAASFEIAGRDRGFADADREAIVADLRRAPTATAMADFAGHDQPRGLVRAPRRRGDRRPLPGDRCRARWSSAPRRTSPRRAPRTACRRSRKLTRDRRRRAAHHQPTRR